MDSQHTSSSGGRPRKDEADKRSIKWQTHFTPAEHEEVTAKQMLSGMSKSEFLRSLALDFEVEAHHDPEELKKIRAQLGKIGGNINQIARAVNSGKDFDEQRFKKMAHWLVHVIEEL